MSGKITIDQLMAALVDYQATHPDAKIDKVSEDSYMITEAGSSAGVELQDGNLSCPRSQSIKDSLLGFILDCATGSKTALFPVGPAKMSTPERMARKGQINGSALGAVRGCQATEKPTYSTGGGRKAAAAKTNIAALMEAGGSFEILTREHRTDFIEVTVRAKMPARYHSEVNKEQHVDSSISIYKQEYLAKKAWDWIVKVLMDEPGIVTGTDEFGMPEFREGSTIKVRISDEGRSLMVALPAKIALWRELAREWQFAGRVCESKAFSRAADMLLRGSFQSAEELKEEQSEVDLINEKEKATTG